jgi:hypothetical protein
MSPASAPSSVSGNRFAATRWSLVAAASVAEPDAARRALIELCLRYWYPVYAYVRGCGHAPDVTQDITRSFFEQVLQERLDLADVRARGRFRQYLLDGLHRFLARDWRAGGDTSLVAEFERPVAWEEMEAAYRRDKDQGMTPEQSYQRSYALGVLASALQRLRDEAQQAGRGAMFDALERWLSAEPAPGEMDAVARTLEIRPLAAVVALKRLRQRFRELTADELSQTVSSAADLDAERAELARALGAP